MKTAMLVMLYCVVGVVCTSTMRAQSTHSCVILDVVQSNAHDQYFLDGKVLSPKEDLMDALRKRQASDVHACLNVFVPLSMTLKSVESIRALAGKLQFDTSHIYLYGRYRKYVTEVLGSGDTESDTVRKGANGSVVWP